MAFVLLVVCLPAPAAVLYDTPGVTPDPETEAFTDTHTQVPATHL